MCMRKTTQLMTLAAILAAPLLVAPVVGAVAAKPTPQTTKVSVIQTPAAATFARSGKLGQQERDDVIRLDAPAGKLRSTITFSSGCRSLKVLLVQNNHRLDADQVTVTRKHKLGTVAAKIRGQVVDDHLRVIIRKPVAQECHTTWVLDTTVQTDSDAAEGAASVVTPQKYGAVGNGIADDTKALQTAFNSLKPGGSLTLSAGKVYRHTAVLKVTVPRVTIKGTGTLLATTEANSALHLAASGIVLDGPTLTMASTTKRWDAFEQMKLRLGRFDAIKVRNVTINGSGAAGIYVGGASNFEISNVVVRNTNADAIHLTGGARDGVVTNPLIITPGDDGVAVVSYRNDGEKVRNITVNSPRLIGQKWGRAYSVVGGDNIRYNNVYAERSAGAAIYVSAESEFNTYGISNVVIEGGQLLNSNQQADVDAIDRPSATKSRVVHGAVILYNSQADMRISDVSIRNVSIRDTHADGYDQVNLRSYNGQVQERIELRNIAISGGSRYNFKVTGVPATGYRAIGWTRDGVALPDKLG